GVVAEPGGVELEALAGDRERPGRLAVLLEVSLRELLAGLLRAHAYPAVAVASAELAAVARRQSEVADVELDRHVGIPRERVSGLAYLEGVREQAALAAVGHAMRGEGPQHLEAQPAGVVGVVGGDLRALEHEGDPPVGQIEAGRHLGVALVRAVAEADE